tara:strand:- start:459 stop:1184 length:726 start_codon:yes stop_codon:yes gene_type:complete
MKQRKVMKFNKPKIKTKQNVDKESFSMNVDEYVRITRKNTNYKSGFTTKTIYLRQPQYLLERKIKKYESLYDGEIKNKRAHGWGKEILIINTWDPEIVEEYYEGEWKNGKRHGYGESYSHHPLIGSSYAFEHSSTGFKREVVVNPNETGVIFKGQWVNGNFCEGVKETDILIQKGKFKSLNNNKNTIFNTVFWNGIEIEKLFDKNFEKKKWNIKNGKKKLLETIVKKGSNKKIKKNIKMKK